MLRKKNGNAAKDEGTRMGAGGKCGAGEQKAGVDSRHADFHIVGVADKVEVREFPCARPKAVL